MQFDQENINFLAVNFSQFLAIKTLDLDPNRIWIRIRIVEKNNADPKHWIKVRNQLELKSLLRITVMCISRKHEQEASR